MSKYLCMSNNGDYFIDFQNLKNSRNGNLLIIFKYLLQKKEKDIPIYIFIIVFRVLRVSLENSKISISMNFQSIFENKLI